MVKGSVPAAPGLSLLHCRRLRATQKQRRQRKGTGRAEEEEKRRRGRRQAMKKAGDSSTTFEKTLLENYIHCRPTRHKHRCYLTCVVLGQMLRKIHFLNNLPILSQHLKINNLSMTYQLLVNTFPIKINFLNVLPIQNSLSHQHWSNIETTLVSRSSSILYRVMLRNH